MALRITVQKMGSLEIDSLEMSVRLHLQLKKLGINNLNDLAIYSVDDLENMLTGQENQIVQTEQFERAQKFDDQLWSNPARRDESNDC